MLISFSVNYFEWFYYFGQFVKKCLRRLTAYIYIHTASHTEHGWISLVLLQFFFIFWWKFVFNTIVTALIVYASLLRSQNVVLMLFLSIFLYACWSPFGTTIALLNHSTSWLAGWHAFVCTLHIYKYTQIHTRNIAKCKSRSIDWLRLFHLLYIPTEKNKTKKDGDEILCVCMRLESSVSKNRKRKRKKESSMLKWRARTIYHSRKKQNIYDNIGRYIDMYVCAL